MLKLFVFLLLSTSLFTAPNLMAQRIVSLGPNMTEIVCELGLCENLVGVTSYCDYPEWVKNVPKVGGYIDPNLEVILGMNPDLVLALPEHQNAALKLKKLGLNVETIRNYDLADIYKSIETIGALTDHEEEATALIARLSARQTSLTRKRARPLRCLLTLGHEVGGDAIKEVFIVGNNGFLNELIYLAGGENVYQRDKPHYPKLTQESLIALDPDVIIDLVPLAELTPAEKEKDEGMARGFPSSSC